MSVWQLGKPGRVDISRFLADQATRALSYRDVGATRSVHPAGWTSDHHRRQLGAGDARFAAARDALQRWQMFPAPMTAVEPTLPPRRDAVVVVVLRALGVWWLNAMRIVYVVDEPRRFGFACGTLPGHVACGEERFLVEHTGDDRVWYDVVSFSRPRLLAARAVTPVTRWLRDRFVAESLAAMERAVDLAMVRL